MSELVITALSRINLILASANVLVCFSLSAYLLIYNFRSAVARTFSLMLLLSSIVYVGDVFLATAGSAASHPAATMWLRFQWLGIAFIAPAFLHFSHALLATTGDDSNRRRLAIVAAYLAGAVALADVLTRHDLVAGITELPGGMRLERGPLFWLFGLAYLVAAAWGAANIWRARQRALTDRSRWRLGLLLIAVVAPLAVFPYLSAGGTRLAAHPWLFRMLAAAVNVATAAMTVVVAYAVAFHGALTPDRALRRDLVKYLIQAPLLGIFVIATIQVVPKRLETSLGLPRDLVLVLATVLGIVAYQFLVRLFKRYVDLAVYGGESGEALWLQRLDERLVTTSDLVQLLENILTALCDRLRVSTGCVVVLEGGHLQLDAFTGDKERAMAFLAALTAEQVVGAAVHSPVQADGFRLITLRTADGRALGLLAFENPRHALSDDDLAAIDALARSAERAVEDRLIQQRVLSAVRELQPEISDLQHLRVALERGNPERAAAMAGGRRPAPATELPRPGSPETGTGEPATAVNDSGVPVSSLPRTAASGTIESDAETSGALEAAPAVDGASPEFATTVKDALGDYWGGPKLTGSPLLSLRTAREALAAHDNNPARALRAVLDQALEAMKPEGERSLTASGWLVYNILELRFVRGMRVRDIARRLAMSEADLYRKQRVAIEALARQLAAMEEGKAKD